MPTPIPAHDLLVSLRSALAARYDIERPLGAGVMATVYLARDLKHDRSVALKVLHFEVAGEAGHERFTREIVEDIGMSFGPCKGCGLRPR